MSELFEFPNKNHQQMKNWQVCTCLVVQRREISYKQACPWCIFAGVRTEPRGASCSQYPTQTLNIHDLLYFKANSMHISLIHKRTFIDFEPELFDRRLTKNRQKQYEDTSKCLAELFAFNRSFYWRKSKRWCIISKINGKYQNLIWQRMLLYK